MQPLSDPSSWEPTSIAPPASGTRWATANLRKVRGRLDALGRRLNAGRQPIAWSLVLLLLFKAVVCFATVAFPLNRDQPTELAALAGTGAVLLAGCVWVLSERIPLLGFELLAAVGALGTSLLIAHARSHGGMMIGAFAYPWIAIYAAHFFPRRAVNALGLLISVAFAVALLLSGLSHVAIYWAIVTATIWSICVLLRNLSASVRREANTDHLTGLFNRGGFMSVAVRERALADRTGAPLTVALVDLDDFKQVNDRDGHAAGDRMLVALTHSWRERMRASDTLARYGGDEFALLLPSTTSAAAAAVLERLGRDEDPVRWSVGLSEWLPGEELDAVLARADSRLYEDKHGRPPLDRRPKRRAKDLAA